MIPSNFSTFTAPKGVVVRLKLSAATIRDISIAPQLIVVKTGLNLSLPTKKITQRVINENIGHELIADGLVQYSYGRHEHRVEEVLVVDRSKQSAREH